MNNLHLLKEAQNDPAEIKAHITEKPEKPLVKTQAVFYVQRSEQKCAKVLISS